MNKQELLRQIDISPKQMEGLPEEIPGIAYDSRKVKPGDLFVCIPGYTSDGHRYIADAVKKGASCVMVQTGCAYETPQVPVVQVKDTRDALSAMSEHLFHDPSRKLLIIGVTGTNGKTTITYMLERVLLTAGKSPGRIGTISYKAGSHVYEAVNTTPESYELSRMFRQMLDEGNDSCVMEVSSHSLAMHRVEHVEFDIGIFTNLTEDHLDFHPDFEAYFQAKKHLFSLVKKAGLINIDDPYGSRMYRELKEEGRRVFSCSAKDQQADYYARVLEKTDTYSEVCLYHQKQRLTEMRIPIPGSFSVYNGLCAFAAACEGGISPETVKAGIQSLPGVPGRFELVPNSRGVVVIVDYAHTPDALIKVLDTANEFKKGRLICVFGCGGDRDRKKRPMMGRAAGQRCDYAIITSDNPRTEDPEKIMKDVEEGITDTSCPYEMIQDRRQAIERAIGMYQKGDVILVAGKGHEDYQIIGTEKHHFDDKEVISQVLSQNG